MFFYLCRAFSGDILGSVSALASVRCPEAGRLGRITHVVRVSDGSGAWARDAGAVLALWQRGWGYGSACVDRSPNTPRSRPVALMKLSSIGNGFGCASKVLSDRECLAMTRSSGRRCLACAGHTRRKWWTDSLRSGHDGHFGEVVFPILCRCLFSGTWPVPRCVAG
jgi:hypothetical protein